MYEIIHNRKMIARVKETRNFISITKGLMFTKKLKPRTGIIIERKEESVIKAAIHMLFVFYPIDVIWLNSKKKVVDKKENVKPFIPLIIPKEAAKYVIELPKGGSKEIKIGDTLASKEISS